MAGDDDRSRPRPSQWPGVNGDGTTVEPALADVAAQAEAVAAEAARRAGVDVVELDEPVGLGAAAELFGRVWSTPASDPPMPAHLLRAFAHAGHYVAGARHGSELVGAATGFQSPIDPGGGTGEMMLHSHIAGVDPGWQGRHVGLALKLHQRAWALARGLRLIEWTFDPLVRRNAYFNVAKLGTLLDAYVPNFYGEMTDGINAGDDSDRCFARWHVASRRAVEASEGRLPEPDPDALVTAGALTLLYDGGQGQPRLAALDRLADHRAALCWVPADIVATRTADPVGAQAWRRALREALGSALAGGFVVTGVTRRGCYVLERDQPEAQP